ncbi:antibiotic biosynthesis monooxygenase [Streptomyces sp. NPDC048248]|uniref:antibiotic biosynthesis monooxygenase n=1 Tax=Streptomyces sp. NPDC048248 TaxID=3365523 RepID=UPI003720B029
MTSTHSPDGVYSGSGDAFRTDVFPEIRRPDSGLVLISEWDAGSPEGQRAAQNGVAHAWEETPLPAGFLSRVLFAGTDGRSVLDYAQWTSGAAHREFVAREETGPLEGIAAAPVGVGGDGDAGPGRFRLYRSLLPEGAAPAPGCVVRVAFRTAGEEAARRLVDGLMDMFDGRQSGAGGIASHFHLSEDGTRVVNYSEWTDAEAHERMVVAELGSGGQVMRLLASLPGVEPLGFRRYTAPRGLVRA